MPRPAVRNSAAPGDGDGAQLIGHLTAIEAKAQRRGDAVIRVTPELIDQVVARVARRRRDASAHVGVPEMTVRVDERRHDGLAAHIDNRRARRCFDGAAWPDSRDSPIVHDERAVLDRRLAFSGQHTSAFEHQRARSGLCRGEPRRDRYGGGSQQQSAHRAPFSVLSNPLR